MTKDLFRIFILFLGIVSLSAQTDSDGESRRPAGRSAWFACTSIPDRLENPVKVMSGKDLTELKLPRYMTSDPVKIPADGIIRIVRERPGPEEPAYLVLAEARIPDGVRNALIILVPLPQPEDDRIFVARVQDLAGFKGGDRMFINLSNTHIRAKLGDTRLTITPRQTNIFEAPVLARPTNMPVMYEFYHPGEKDWKILSASTIVLRPTRREINIFNEGSRLGKIRRHKILFPVQSERP